MKRACLLVTSSPFKYGSFDILQSVQVNCKFQILKLTGIDFIEMPLDQQFNFWLIFENTVCVIEIWNCYISETMLIHAIDKLKQLKHISAFIMNYYSVPKLISKMSEKLVTVSLTYPAFNPLPGEITTTTTNNLQPQTTNQPSSIKKLGLFECDYSNEIINEISKLYQLDVLILTNAKKQFPNEHFPTIFYYLQNLTELNINSEIIFSNFNYVLSANADIRFLQKLRKISLKCLVVSSEIAFSKFKDLPNLEILNYINITGQMVRKM